MKIILLLCLVVGAFCFAAKDALNTKTTQLANGKLLTAERIIHQKFVGAQIIEII